MQEEANQGGQPFEGGPRVERRDIPGFNQELERPILLASSQNGLNQALLLLKINNPDHGRLVFFESGEVKNGIFTSEFLAEIQVVIQNGAGESQEVELDFVRYTDDLFNPSAIFRLGSGSEVDCNGLRREFCFFKLFYRKEREDRHFIGLSTSPNN